MWFQMMNMKVNPLVISLHCYVPLESDPFPTDARLNSGFDTYPLMYPHNLHITSIIFHKYTFKDCFSFIEHTNQQDQYECERRVGHRSR